MKLNYEYLGLCSNCHEAPSCSYRMNHNGPILFCEEFCYENRKLNNNEYRSTDNERRLNYNTKHDNKYDSNSNKVKNSPIHWNEFIKGKGVK